MRTRDAVLLYQEQQSSNKSSKTIDLSIVDPVTALGFEFEARNGSTNNQNNPLPFAIPKIEVVDGSDVLSALSFRQMQALHFYKTGKQPQLREDEGPSAWQVIGTSLLFGRYLYDQEFVMDFRRFKNPQLKITWDLNNIRDVDASTAWATGTLKISVWAKTMEEFPVAPSQFLMAKEIEAWTGATSGDKRHDLPVDHIIRMLMLLQHNSFAEPDISISKIKLTADTDKFIPLERYMKQFDAEMAQLFGNVVVWKRHHAAHNDTIWFPVFKEPQLHMIATVLNHIWAYGWCWSGNAQLIAGDTAGGTISADERFDSLIEGHALHCSVPIPMGDMLKPETWFDPTPYKKLEMVCTEGSATNNTLVAEQVRPL